jgi:hypothetical protein
MKGLQDLVRSHLGRGNVHGENVKSFSLRRKLRRGLVADGWRNISITLKTSQRVLSPLGHQFL